MSGDGLLPTESREEETYRLRWEAAHRLVSRVSAGYTCARCGARWCTTVSYAAAYAPPADAPYPVYLVHGCHFCPPPAAPHAGAHVDRLPFCRGPR
jgi:hypothetical protein